MTITLRVILIVMSVATASWILHRIKKSQVKITDSVFWFFFSAFLVIMGLFPQIVEWGAALFGVYSAVNFVFLAIIFVLIVKLFRMSIRISQLETKLQGLAQRYSLDRFDERKH